MSRIYLALTIVCLSLVMISLSSCASSALFFVNNLARLGDYQIQNDIPYGEMNKQSLDIYIPDDLFKIAKADRITVVFFYGGCWGACSDLAKDDYRFVAQAFTANNIIAVVVDYRQYPKVLFPAIMSDAQTAVTWITNNIGTYGGNASNIYLMGHSAGAHIASLLVFNRSYLAPTVHKSIKGFIGLAGPYDFLPFDEPYQPTLFGSLIDKAESQTIHYVTGKNEPRSLLLYGEDDSRVKRRNIISLRNTIIKKNGQVETIIYPDIDHVGIIAALSIPLRSGQPVMNDILTFISPILTKNATKD